MLVAFSLGKPKSSYNLECTHMLFINSFTMVIKTRLGKSIEVQNITKCIVLLYLFLKPCILRKTRGTILRMMYELIRLSDQEIQLWRTKNGR